MNDNGGLMLQLFVYVNVFLAGVAVAFAAHYAYTHFWSKRHGHPSASTTEAPTLSKAARDRLLHNAEATFKAILEHAAGELQFDLKDTSDSVSGKLKQVGDEIIDTEMNRYQESLEGLRKETEEIIGSAAKYVAEHQADTELLMIQRRKEMETALSDIMNSEKDRLQAAIDTKLAGSVTSFLIETLGHDVDLGAQSTYLIKQLDEHKQELIKELRDEV